MGVCLCAEVGPHVGAGPSHPLSRGANQALCFGEDCASSPECLAEALDGACVRWVEAGQVALGVTHLVSDGHGDLLSGRDLRPLPRRAVVGSPFCGGCSLVLASVAAAQVIAHVALPPGAVHRSQRDPLRHTAKAMGQPDDDTPPPTAMVRQARYEARSEAAPRQTRDLRTPRNRQGLVAVSRRSPGVLWKMPSLETSGTPRRRAVAATERSASCSRWLRAWPMRSQSTRRRA